MHEFTHKVTALLSPEKQQPSWQLASVLGPLQERGAVSENTVRDFSKLRVATLHDFSVLLALPFNDIRSEVPSLSVMEFAHIRVAVAAAVKPPQAETV